MVHETQRFACARAKELNGFGNVRLAIYNRFTCNWPRPPLYQLLF